MSQSLLLYNVYHYNESDLLIIRLDSVNLRLFCFQLTLVLNIYIVIFALFAHYRALLVHFGVEVIYMLLNICSQIVPNPFLGWASPCHYRFDYLC